jgi:hypothetical protein
MNLWPGGGMIGWTTVIEIIGWISTASFLVSILVPQRIHLHILGIFTSVTTGFYAYEHGATAIWVKWVIAFFFHVYMTVKVKKKLSRPEDSGLT